MLGVAALAQRVDMRVFHKKQYVTVLTAGFIQFLLPSRLLLINEALLYGCLQVPYRPIGGMTQVVCQDGIWHVGR